jgi:aspartate beta-hydroxylase
LTQFYEKASAVVRRVFDWRIQTPAILDMAQDFPNSSRFISNWRNIRDEALALRTEKLPRFHEIMPEQADISANDGRDWRIFILKAYDIAVHENLAHMPTVAALLADCPEVKSATISVLAPHKHIPSHRGPFRGIMRFHLGLQVPLDANGAAATVMCIDGLHYRIVDGQGMLWDDTFPHEVTNDSDQPRVALLLDVWRPRMPADMELLSRLIVGAVQLSMRYRGVT